MRLRRARLPVLAEISGDHDERPGVWSLCRADHASLAAMLPRLERKRAVLVTGDGDVAPLVAVAVASAAASAGRRTALVECDVVRPRLAAALGLRAEPGLHEYLRWEAQPEEIVQPVLLAGPAAAGVGEPLACVCAGRPAANPETLLGLGSFLHAIAKLRSAYELVVLAGPPVTEAPGSALVVARQADSVVAGLPAPQASGREGRSLRRAVRNLPAPALGTVAVA
jgi:Mrp family chromosome partitioning ATPase